MDYEIATYKAMICNSDVGYRGIKVGREFLFEDSFRWHES